MKTERLYRAEAIVLRRQDFGEADRVLTLFSPRLGKFRAVAKGVRRPKSRLGGHVELFTRSNLQLAHGRNLDIVTQAETVKPLHTIRHDLWKAAYACYAVDLVDQFMVERVENEAIYHLLAEFLLDLDGQLATPTPAGPEVGTQSRVTEAGTDYRAGASSDGPSPDQTGGEQSPGARTAAEPSGGSGRSELVMRNFEARLLVHAGHGPELFHCVRCGDRLQPVSHYFSATDGGVLCSSCSEVRDGGRIMSVNAIKALRLMCRQPFGVAQRLRLSAGESAEIEGALRAHIGSILERHLRTSEFLDRMKADQRREHRLAAASAVSVPA